MSCALRGKVHLTKQQYFTDIDCKASLTLLKFQRYLRTICESKYWDHVEEDEIVIEVSDDCEIKMLKGSSFYYCNKNHVNH